jgi:hypothetical protein
MPNPFAKKKKLADLPDSHAEELQQPCDWCGHSINHERPPASVYLHTAAYWEGRNWRICEGCLDALIELVKARA